MDLEMYVAVLTTQKNVLQEDTDKVRKELHEGMSPSGFCVLCEGPPVWEGGMGHHFLIRRTITVSLLSDPVHSTTMLIG